MTPDEITAILNALDRIDGKLDLKADRTDIARLEGKVDKTNGRVTKLEADEIRSDATAAAKDGVKRTIWKATAATIAACASLVVIGFLVVDHV